MMKNMYLQQAGNRLRFRIVTPKKLWQWIPKNIIRELDDSNDVTIEYRCECCGNRLKELFRRAINGTVALNLLKDLINEVCNAELYRSTPKPETVQIQQEVPSQQDLLSAFLRQMLQTMNVNVNLPMSAQKPVPEAPVQNIPSFTLKEVADLYLKEKESCSNVNPKTEKDRRNGLGLLIEYLGEDFVLNRLTRADMIDIRANLLKKYPWNRKKLYPHLSLKEVLQLKNMEKYISETTITRYLEFWNGFFNWAVQSDYMLKNPAIGISERAEFFDVRELRPPFTTDELTSIFTMIADLPYRPRFMPKLYPMRYWVNLIALYQGMRLNEICQLYLDDVILEESIPCFRIRPDKERQQKVKNKSSIRTIPIHSAILRFGFLEYCQEIRTKAGTLDTVLFQPATALDGGYQRKMQQFNALIHSLPKMDERKSIHSYRHNFDTELLNKGAKEYFILCLDGHTRNGELMSRYAKPDIHKLQATLELVTYDGFDPFRCLNKSPISDETIADQVKTFFLQ